MMLYVPEQEVKRTGGELSVHDVIEKVKMNFLSQTRASQDECGAEYLIEIPNWFVGGSWNGAHLFCLSPRDRDLNFSKCT